jgi:hypothetical protein
LKLSFFHWSSFLAEYYFLIEGELFHYSVLRI